MRGVSISLLMHYNREANARVRCEVDSYVIVHEHLAFDGFRFVGDDLAVANALEFLRPLTCARWTLFSTREVAAPRHMSGRPTRPTAHVKL